MEEPYLGMYRTRFFDVEEGLGGAESRGIWGSLFHTKIPRITLAYFGSKLGKGTNFGSKLGKGTNFGSKLRKGTNFGLKLRKVREGARN
jgi:hypothetical protein